MADIEIVDTFPAFLVYWSESRGLPIERQIDGWTNDYMVRWPELLRKQVDDYTSEGFEWRAIARERIFPELDSRVQEMQIARDNLLELAPDLLSRASKAFQFGSDLVIVIYVGIGLGAGWATTFDNRPAILFGLENIAECGWSQITSLSGLVAHEFGHLAHFHARKVAGIAKDTGPMWRLIEEGYAMRYEQLIMGGESWHMIERGGGRNWLDWCKSHRSWLAFEFLNYIETGESLRPFFGSWYDLQGYRQTGYYLGHELVRMLESDMTLDEIALSSEEDPRLWEALTTLAEEQDLPDQGK